LTKQEPVEPTLKCHETLDAAGKVSVGSPREILEKNTFSIHAAQMNSEGLQKSKVILVRDKTTSRRSNLGKVAEKLFDLEPCGEPEKPLKVDLDLYQMEDY
jgi:hypothetical protein